MAHGTPSIGILSHLPIGNPKHLQWPSLHRRRTVHGMCRDPPRGSLVIGNNEAFYTADIRDTNENEE